MSGQHELTYAPGAKKAVRRVGRGAGSGRGRYSGRGCKGQKSRSGGGVSPYFEGGQLPLVKRLPHKRGFTNPFTVKYQVINVGDLNRFQPETTVGVEDLESARLIRTSRNRVKVLGEGELRHPLVVRANMFSNTAREKIINAGGKAEQV
ncbi:MAG: 50S ribosomal protein L15 [Chloroflexota bacterium]|nr:50S ribosomal protein L15 [Chloroflexota bacterium]